MVFLSLLLLLINHKKNVLSLVHQLSLNTLLARIKTLLFVINTRYA